VVDHVRNGSDPTPDAGLDFINTGIKLVTDKPVDGLDSITSDEGLKLCY
jgi:fructose transport system substrate-binding protein